MKTKMGKMESVESVLAHFEEETEERIEELRKCLPVYFFVENRNEKNKVWCSCCREHMDVKQDTRHRRKMTCPNCGHSGEVIRIWRMRKRILEEGSFIRYAASAQEPDVVTATIYNVKISYTMGKYETWEARLLPSESMFQWEVRARYMWRYGCGAVMITRKECCGAREYWLKDDITMAEYAQDNGMFQKKKMFAIVGNPLAEAAKETRFRYVLDTFSPNMYDLYDPYEQEKWFSVMTKTARHPFVTECLAKLSDTTKNMLVNEAVSGVINWKGKTVAKVFKANPTKEDKAWMRKSVLPTLVFIRMLKKWQQLQNKGYAISMQIVYEYGLYEKGLRTAEYERECHASVLDERKVISYLKRQREKHAEVRIDYRYYMDYLGMARRAGYPMEEKSYLYPKDLVTAHDRALEHVNRIRELERQARREEEQKAKEKKEASQQTKWNKRRMAVKRALEYSDEHFAIVIPEDLKELIEEGNVQHNCVGTYIDRVADGRTTVVFLRTSADPKEHVGTIEVRGGDIVQARGKYNKELDGEAKAFVDRFLEEKVKKNIDLKERKSA